MSKTTDDFKPYIGAIVVFTQPPAERPFNGHADHPAIVTQAWTNECVNLKVLFDCGPTEDRTSTPHLSAGFGWGWRWPEEA